MSVVAIMIEPVFQHGHHLATGTFVVVQVSPRRWVVAERIELYLHNPEYRVVTRPFTNRVDAHAVCTELATKAPAGYSPVTVEHLLSPDSFRGTTFLRSHLVQRSEN
jgi:hypothetical protein